MKAFIENVLNWDIVTFELTAIFVIFIMIIGLAFVVWCLDKDNEKLEKLVEDLIDKEKR